MHQLITRTIKVFFHICKALLAEVPIASRPCTQTTGALTAPRPLVPKLRPPRQITGAITTFYTKSLTTSKEWLKVLVTLDWTDLSPSALEGRGWTVLSWDQIFTNRCDHWSKDTKHCQKAVTWLIGAHLIFFFMTRHFNPGTCPKNRVLQFLCYTKDCLFQS